MNDIEKFDKRFSKDILDMIILTQEAVSGGINLGDYLRPSLNFIASVNMEDGTLSKEVGRLEWLVEKGSENKWGYNFEQYGIYRIKARKNIPIELTEYMSVVMNNCYMVVDVIDMNASEPGLEAIRQEISKPVVIENEIGKFTLERSVSWFEGKCDWCGSQCNMCLVTDDEFGSTAENAEKFLLSIYEDVAAADDKYREFAADEMLECANDWVDDEEDEISKEEFKKRLSIDAVIISPEGEITLYYNDGGMFGQHQIEITANINGDMISVDIAG